LEVLFDVGVEVFLAEPNELAGSDEAYAAFVYEPSHQPRRDAEALSGGFDREWRLGAIHVFGSGVLVAARRGSSR
jgi:hypothetical protein